MRCQRYNSPFLAVPAARLAAYTKTGSSSSSNLARQHAQPCSSLCGLSRRVKLHNVSDRWEVEPPGRHIRAQQHPRGALCEEQEGLGALRLQRLGRLGGRAARVKRFGERIGEQTVGQQGE